MASSFGSSGLRIRLLEPSTGIASGGTRIVIHGKGFRPQPHSLLVRFRLAETNTRMEVNGKFLLETQLECVIPSFQDDARSVIARFTNLAPSSSTVALAPHLVPLQVEVILDSERISNVLAFVLHQEIAITKITPQFVLMSPPTTITATLNLLKLSSSSRLFPPKDKANSSAHQELTEISTLPVFVRVRQVSERTTAVSERIVEARWRISPVGVYEIEFDCVMMTFGDATVELTLNKLDYFRAKTKTPDAVGYCVQRDVTLVSVDPPCLSVNSGRVAEVRLLGDGFVDSGDLVVRLLQRDIHETSASGSALATTGEAQSVAQLTATYVNPNELRCSVHPNMSFGLTFFQVSLNGGRQFGRDRATALLHRNRNVESITPSFASLEGNTLVTIQLACLTVDDVDAPHQVLHLVPPRRVRVKFQAILDESAADSSASGVPGELVKVVNAEMSPPGGGGAPLERGVVRCRVPSFFDEIKLLEEKRRKELAASGEQRVDENASRIGRFHVSLALGGDAYFGSLTFGCFFPPVIQSITRHHGPRTGGTLVVLRMKYRVPTQLAIQVRFLEIATRKSETVAGVVGTEYIKQHGHIEALAVGSPRRARDAPSDDPAFVIVCTSPAWRQSKKDGLVLTKVQVSMDGGFNYVPPEEEHELVAAGLATPRARAIPSQLVKDMSHLYFLFYPVPRLYSVVPMSADIQGGSFVRISGDHVVDHGGQISVVFQSPQLSRKVVGFIENGELRCCVPPYNVGPAIIFVSLNGEQYTKCEFVDPDSKRPIDFVFYSSPLLQRLSPLCTSISHSSLIHIFGVNLIETGRVKVRFGFTSHHGKLVYKDVAAKAADGVIMAQSPVFGSEYGNLNAVVDVALNGNDFSGRMLSLYYYSSYAIRRVEPPVGAYDIPIPLTVRLSQSILSDALLVRVRFKHRYTKHQVTFGPVPVTRWEGNLLEFTLPAINEFVESVDALEGARLDVSFDKSYFHDVGELLDHYRVYKLPPVSSVSPLVGYFEQETCMVAKSSSLKDDDVVTITLTLEAIEKQPTRKTATATTATTATAGSGSGSGLGIGKTPVVVAVVAETNLKRQTLTWRCPPLTKLLKTDLTSLMDDSTSMLLAAKLAMQISTIHGQLLSLPFQLQYYRLPVLLAMSPQVGYICGGSLISFEFKEPIETPTVDFRFGVDVITGGRVRSDDKRFVECLSPELEAGVHDLAMSFDEQYFETMYLDKDDGEGEPQHKDAFDQCAASQATKTKTGCRMKGTFQAFAMPHFTIPGNRHRVYGFGSIDGNSYVAIRGRGFIAEGKIYVRFCSSDADALVASPGSTQSEVIVNARVLDDSTILCASPPATRPGRVMLQVTYNLQQYTDSSCFFEYHERTTFASRGILCGPVSGGTPVCIQVQDAAGLPEDKTLLSSSCALRFTSDDTGHSQVVDAVFDEDTLTIQCIAPLWPSNELVFIEVTLSRDVGGGCTSSPLQQFISTGVRFLFYDPPEGLITIEPSAGPITGGTEVLAWCGKIVDTGEIMVSVTIVDDDDDERERGKLKMLTSVGEDDKDEGDDDDDDGDQAKPVASQTPAVSTAAKEVHLVKGKIVGEAVSFIAPAVSKPGIAYLNIALNGINYTSSQTSTLRFKYYCNPVIRRISPAWCAMDSLCVITISGDYIEDHGCKAVIQLLQQQPPHGDKERDKDREKENCILIGGTFVDTPQETKSAVLVNARALQCSFQAPQAGFFEIQVSLNDGQQFSSAKFMHAAFGNYSGSACTALLPFRCFSSPFLLASPTGSVAGGSTVTLFMNKKLSKMLARETKCQVQFVPVRSGDAASSSTGSSGSSNNNSASSSSGGNAGGGGSPQKTASLVNLHDGVSVAGEIDHSEGKITCRAPLLRTPCTAALDILLPLSVTVAADAPVSASVGVKTTASAPLVSCAAFFNVRDREKFYAYESPTITELAPTCGPLSGGTCIVIECSNIVDTGQIFVRFRSSANERECVLVPAMFSRTFPDGSLCASPLLICQTPLVEIIDRIIVSSSLEANASSLSPSRVSGTRDGSTGSMTAKARAQSYQQMAEQSLRFGSHRRVLRVTRTVLKNAPVAALGGGAVSVLVDFTMNAGEQFIAHSVQFQFYPDLVPNEVKWSPRHVPTRCFERGEPAETRIVTIQLPKSLRSFTDSAAAAERVSFYFQGTPQQLFSSTQKRRGSSIVLHETGAARELLVLDSGPSAKLRTQSTMRRRSTFLRNSSISASSNNLLDSSGASLAANVTRQRAAPPKGGGNPRRPSGAFATSAGGLTTLTGGSTSSSPSKVPTAGTSPALADAPYIAAKIVKGGLELTCPVPEFSCAGSVQVFFSFNAQQFVCLGELFIHDPLVIREDKQHRFTSNIGGDRFVLSCSPSTVFSYLLQRYVINEEELLAKQRRATGLVKTSRVFECENDEAAVGIAGVDASLGDGRETDSAWHDRLFYVVHVHLVPPNPRLLRKVVVSATCLGSNAELATSTPDDLGCCAFETTDWMNDMILAASVASTESTLEWSSFSCVLPKARFHKKETNAGSKTPPDRMHALLVQLPLAASGIAAVSCSVAGSTARKFTIRNGDGTPLQNGGVKHSASGSGSAQYSHVAFDPSNSPTATHSRGWWFVCMDFRCAEDPSVPEANDELHALVADASGIRVYLTGQCATATGRGVWVVACVARIPSGFTVVEVDRIVDSTEDLGLDASLIEFCTSAVQMATSNASRVEEMAKPTTVVTSVQFTCADSSKNLSASAEAQVVLPGAHTLESFLETTMDAASFIQTSGATLNELQLQCDMPSLSFSGPTILSIAVDGVIFSNSLCVHCYDPRLWRITRLDPPCGLVHKPLRLRIKGEEFVDNKKTLVRISDATRYVNCVGTMERYRLLVVRIANVRNVRNLLPAPFAGGLLSASGGSTGGGGGSSSPQRAQQQPATQYRDDGIVGASSPFTLAVRVDYRDQTFRATSRESAVLAALSTAVGWEDQFEVEVPADAIASALLVVTLELVELTANRSHWEIGRIVVPVKGLEDAGLTKRVYRVEEHFRWRRPRASVSSSAASVPPPPVTSDADVFLHLSPLMTRSDVVVCDLRPFVLPQRLGIQISSGDAFFSPYPVIKHDESPPCSDGFQPVFQAYHLPIVNDTKPNVLPRTAGGEIMISGEGFVDCGESSGQICVRLFGCSPSSSETLDERMLLAQINSTESIQPIDSSPFFVRDVVATFVSPTCLHLTLPPRLASYKIYYRVSMDGGFEFSQATPQSRVMLYSADAVEPKGGPVSGNTYVAVHGTNLNACMALGGLVPVVRLTWMRGIKELEHVVVRGEFYPPENIVYFYTPQSKFGLQNITVHIEIALATVSTGAPSSDMLLSLSPTVTSAPVNMTGVTAAFGQDEIPFVIYRTPTIRSIAPLHALVCGLSAIELMVQGLDEKATVLLKNSIKARFKRRGQMQIADVLLHPGAGSEGKLLTIVPRFIVGSAVATDVVAGVVPTPAALQTSPTRTGGHTSAATAAVNAMRNNGSPLKVWTRQGAVFVLLLRARNLFVGKKTATCNPFAIVNCDKAQLKSARKDGTSSPVWNELFDFDWRNQKELPRGIRVSVENQLSSDQSELLGQVQIKFADAGGELSQPFCVRAWFPLRKVTTRGGASAAEYNGGKRVNLGDIELVLAYLPAPAKKVAPPKFLQAVTFKTSIMTAMRQQKKTTEPSHGDQHKQQQQQQQSRMETPRTRKERLLRAFRRQGAPASLAPSELIVELAINGQDFWSSAPSRSGLVPTPIVLSAEPSFICMGGGTPLTISGMNFVATGAIRVAFAVVADGATRAVAGSSPTRLAPQALDSKRIAVVDAKYRSSHCVSCVTPPLKALGATELSIVNIYVTINGLDFDSVAVPLESVMPPAEEQLSGIQDKETSASPRVAPTSTQSALQMVGSSYMIDHRALRLTSVPATAVLPAPRPLLHHVCVYLRPIIQRVRPADGVYTSLLVIEGRDFSNTGVAIAKYSSKTDTHDVRTSHVTVVSTERMECAMPDFPRGTVVTMSIAMNGLEFVSCPGEFAVFQSPRLTEIVPSWMSTASSSKLHVRLCGVNLTTNSKASGAVDVSFTRGTVSKTIKGQCVDGEVLCSVPTELTADETSSPSDVGDTDLVLTPSILVDVWLGGTHKTFTGRPMELHLYRRLPEVAIIAPMNGPIYGGYTVTIEGSGFINTGKIVARFQLLQEPSTRLEKTEEPATRFAKPVVSSTAQATNTPQQVSTFVTFVDASARFVSAETVVCDAPSFPQEGVYSVSVALNGVEFNVGAASQQSTTWFLAWQNWQRRKQLMAQRVSLEMVVAERMREAIERESDLTASVPLTPLSPLNPLMSLPASPSSALLLRPPTSPRSSTPGIVEMAFGRRVPSRSLGSTTAGGDDSTLLGAHDSPRRRQQQQRQLLDKMIDDENLDRVDDSFVDVRLLQWHPATTEDKSRSLLTILTDLFNAPETQQIMIRRVGFVFRMRGSRDASTGQYSIGGCVAFTHALKLIFPHAPETQFNELWRALDPSQLGFVSLQSMAKRLIVCDTLRPESPEPGPTHYTPRHAVVETKPPVAVILPPPAASDPRETGLPSELFMNYDAFKAVRPRVKGGVFPKRKFSASWCNPVPKEQLFQAETDDEMERSFAEHRASKPQRSLAGAGLGSLATSSLSHHLTPRPPPSGSGSAFALPLNRSNWKPSFAPGSTTSGFPDDTADATGAASGSSGQATTNKQVSRRDASPVVAQSTAMRRFSTSNSSGDPANERSILHDDIAPLYLKFLRSKEVQKGRNNTLE